jgi:MFS family permease
MKSCIAVTLLLLGSLAFGQSPTNVSARTKTPRVYLDATYGHVYVSGLYARVTDPNMLLWVGAVMGMCVNGMMGGLGALISECYPTAARATAQNVLFNIGRAVGGLGPLVVGSIAAKYSFNAAITLLASVYSLDIFATVFLMPELKGKELE